MIFTDATHNVLVGDKCYRHLRGRWAVFHSSRPPSWSERDASSMRDQWDKIALEVSLDGEPETLTGWFLLDDYENTKIDLVVLIAEQMGLQLDIVNPRAFALNPFTPMECTADILKAAVAYAQNPDLAIDFEMGRLERFWGSSTPQVALDAGRRLREAGLRSR